MYDIKQITNYDLQGFDTEVINGTQYAVIPASFLGADISKLSYCVTKPSGIGSSFYITVNNKTFEIIIGKTGMYELNIEQYFNNQVNQTKTIEVKVTQLKLPMSIPFVLDYATFGVTDNVIYKKVVKIPSQKGNLIYTGKTIYPSFNNFSSKDLIMIGETEAKDAGQHVVTFKLKPDRVWEDGTVEEKRIPWNIEKEVIQFSILPHQLEIPIYNGEEIKPSWSAYDKNRLFIQGQTKGINAGEYTVFFSPTKNCIWEDGTEDLKEVKWQIKQQAVSYQPFCSNELYYNGNRQSPEWDGYNQEFINVNAEPQINAGTYEATFTIVNENYIWEANNSNILTVTWDINRQKIDDTGLQFESNQFIYDGNPHLPIFTFDEDKLAVDEYGLTERIDAGFYYLSYYPKENYCWEDGGTYYRYADWMIERQMIDLFPEQQGELRYTGEELSPIWDNYDENIMSKYYNLSAIDVGTYNTTFYLNDNYYWPDKTYGSKSISWEIKKGIVSFDISETNVVFDTGDPIEITITGYTRGPFAIVSSDTRVARGTVNEEGILTIISKSGGEATLTISVDSPNAECEDVKTITVISNLPEFTIPLEPFATATEEDLAIMLEAAYAGEIDLEADAGWKIGDERKVQLSSISASNSLESQSSQQITLVLMHKSGYKQYGQNNNTLYIVGMKNCLSSSGQLDTSTSNYGWSRCKRRTWCNNSFKNALPEGIRNLFKQVEVKSTNYSSTSNLTTTYDYFFFPTEHEVRNACTHSYSVESSLPQWDYFKTYSKTKNYGDAGYTAEYWTRSIYSSSSYPCATITTNGGSDYWKTTSSYGISVAGCI